MDKISLGHRIREVRGNAGLVREEFAGRMGVTPATVGRYEKGERIPDADFLYQLVTIFGCNPEWILTGEGSMKREEESKSGQGEIDVELHVAVLNVVDELLESMEKQPTREQKSRLVAALYRLASERKDRTIDRTTALNYLLDKLMAA